MVKNLQANARAAGDVGLIPGSVRLPAGANGNLLQYSFLENPMDRGAWWAAVHGVSKSRTRLSDFTFSRQPTPVFLPGESQGGGESRGLPSMGSHRVGHD